MLAFYIGFALLVFAILMLTRPGVEQFVDATATALPTPPDLFKRARELLAKYDRPELWIHAANVMDKDPGQLARMNLGILNGQ